MPGNDDGGRDSVAPPSPRASATPPASRTKRARESTVLELGARKKPGLQDPLVHHGRHFGRTVHAFCNIHMLLLNALHRATDPDYAEVAEEHLPMEERKEIQIYRELLRIVPKLEERIMMSSEEELRLIADLLQKGAAGARADDTKTLKSNVIDWISPRDGPLIPPIARNVKSGRGFNHEATGALLCPANLDWNNIDVKAKLKDAEYVVSGDQWPMLLYQDYRFDIDEPWTGLLRSRLLVSAYKHVFTSPSSVEKELKATRSGNARIHGMNSVTLPSIAYIATQVRFALSSSSVFSRSDTMTDSQRFYNSVVEFLEDPEEQVEVNELLTFWNRQIFPESIRSKRPISRDSALARLKERRKALKERSFNR